MDSYGILGQVNNAAAGVYEVLYTAPVRASVDHGSITVDPLSSVLNSQTSVTSIIVCNRGAADTFSIRLLPTAATSATAVHDLFLTAAIAANDTIVLSLGLVLSADNTIEVTCAIQNRVSFTAMGVEIT